MQIMFNLKKPEGFQLCKTEFLLITYSTLLEKGSLPLNVLKLRLILLKTKKLIRLLIVFLFLYSIMNTNYFLYTRIISTRIIRCLL